MGYVANYSPRCLCLYLVRMRNTETPVCPRIVYDTSLTFLSMRWRWRMCVDLTNIDFENVEGHAQISSLNFDPVSMAELDRIRFMVIGLTGKGVPRPRGG